MANLVSRAKLWTMVFALFLCAAVANGSEAEDVPRCDQSPPQMTPPPYPEQLKGTKIGGVVVLILTLDSCGSVIDVGVERSSRNRDLDRAAIEGARAWRFVPTTDGQGNTEPRRVRVPVDFTKAGVDFMPDPEARITGRTRDGFFLRRRQQNASIPARATDGGIRGYIMDVYPIGVATVAEGLAVMELHGRRQRDPAPSVRTYEINDEEGVSYWVLDESQPGRRALMRQRMVQNGGDTFAVTSWLCEPQGSDACSAFQVFLERMPSQPRFGPLPPPPPAD